MKIHGVHGRFVAYIQMNTVWVICLMMGRIKLSPYKADHV